MRVNMVAMNRNIDNSWTGTGRAIDEAMKNMTDSLEGVFGRKDWIFKTVDPVVDISVKNDSTKTGSVEDIIIITVYVNVSGLCNSDAQRLITEYNKMYHASLFGKSNMHLFVVPVRNDRPMEVRVISHNNETTVSEENHNDNKKGKKRV